MVVVCPRSLAICVVVVCQVWRLFGGSVGRRRGCGARGCRDGLACGIWPRGSSVVVVPWCQSGMWVVVRQSVVWRLVAGQQCGWA